ncbi:MAG: SUMF1/EgtB/PvdO family nonheme iron enzyme [Phaeodactylibacter sp.]|nr:SUMF1/EgtB/PvdO family nonheme iron enzyme [Phaeodactylibacter sp.]
MTCRTQYFPGQEDNPYELKVKRPDEKGFFILNKLYLSPFTDKEVKRYLNKKYGYLRLWNRAKKKRAAQLVGQARHLVMRPMMLSYIDYLVEDNRSYQLDYDIYETLIEKWLIREAKKRKHLEEEKAFVNNLRHVSQQTAIAIYQHWRLYLTREEAIAIAGQNGIELKPEEVTGQSLLTCDGLGHWKFAHKSILEFFLAKEAIGNVEFLRTFIFTGMDMAKRFFEEKIPKNFFLVEGSSFIMGSFGDYTSHQVVVNSFWICKNQVTQAEYVEVTGKRNPSNFKGNDNHPVEKVNWIDAIEFCNQLNKKRGFLPVYDAKGNLLDSAGKVTNDITKVHGFRLPTEAEWEYAARGGNQSKGYEYSGSNDIKEVAWFSGNSDSRTHPVGTLKPNELGIYDMSGNVWEWCYDWLGEKYYDECNAKGTVENPIGPESGRSRVVRGGSWIDGAPDCRTADRGYDYPETRYFYQGFRLVFVP